MTSIDEDWDGPPPILPKQQQQQQQQHRFTKTAPLPSWLWAQALKPVIFAGEWIWNIRSAYFIVTNRGHEPGWSSEPKSIGRRVWGAVKFLHACRVADMTPLDRCESCGGNMDNLCMSNNIKFPRCLTCGKPGHPFHGYP